MVSARVEIEVKFPVSDPAALRARLRRLGFRPGRSRQETNWLFDDARATLRRSGRLLRLRKSGARWLLTAKGPRRHATIWKERPEAETAVAGGPQARALLELLGYRATLAYARRRTLWTRPGERGEIAFDTTPFGAYLELEGPPAWIRQTARTLQLDLGNAEPRSYPALYAARVPDRKAQQEPGTPRPSRKPRSTPDAPPPPFGASPAFPVSQTPRRHSPQLLHAQARQASRVEGRTQRRQLNASTVSPGPDA